MAKLERNTAYTRTFLMVLSSDSKTGATGKSPTVNISKAGGTGAAAAGSVSEVDSTHNPGLYKVAFTTADLNTRGELSCHASATGCDDTDWIDQVDDTGIYHGTVTGAATTTTLIDSNLTQADTGLWNNRTIIFVNSTAGIRYEATKITGFLPGSNQLTFGTVTTAPSTGDEYIVI